MLLFPIRILILCWAIFKRLMSRSIMLRIIRIWIMRGQLMPRKLFMIKLQRYLGHQGQFLSFIKVKVLRRQILPIRAGNL